MSVSYSTPASADIAPLESVLSTDELERRPSRPPHYKAENRALVSLTQALADSPRTILQTLADTILAVLRCGSAGVSLLTQDEKRFHWPAVAGVWKPHIGGGTPRDFGPCGDVLDRNAPLMLTHVARRYPSSQPVTPLVEECLLVPFYVHGKAVGTIWAIIHDPSSRKFDKEDLRMLTSLGRFASSAYWAAESLSNLERQGNALRDVNEALLVSSVRQHELTELAIRAEAAMRESEVIQHFSLQGAGAGTWTWEAASGAVTWSLECYELFGIDPQTKMRYDSWRNALYPDDRERADAAARLAMDRHEDLLVEYRIRHPARGVRWLTSIGRIIDPLNRPGYMTGISLDITERKHAEEATARLAAIVTSSEDAIISKDLDGVITSWNKGAEHLFGYASKEVMGKPISLLIPSDHLDEGPRILERIRRGETIEHYETVRRRKDGSLLDVSLTVSPLRDTAGRVIGASKIARDVTERRRLEDQTREQAAELSDLHRRKDEFMAMLGHELRNPLAPIANAVQLLRLVNEPGAIQEQARTIIERQVGQLTRLIEDLMEVSRMSTGRIHLQEEQLDLRGVVERAVETVRPLIAQHRHALVVALSEAPVWLYGDAGRLEQVVVNLLSNAAKYTDNAGHIWLGAEQAGDEAVVRVRDTGVGIAPDLLPRIFDLFTQGDRSLDRSQGGLGVGLALVRQIVQLHRGRVEASSVVGQGSEFIVRLPVVAPPTYSASPTAAGPADATTGRCRVLVVDDNVDCIYSMKTLLARVGHEVATALDGPTALEAVRAFAPQVVLLDIGIPKLDGYEVARRIRAESTLDGVLLVATTGYGQEVDRQRSREAGFDHHLVKPLDFKKVQELLGLAEQRPQGR